ncbi:MAG: asparagine synthase (glutamine-hydrolyzing) [Gemmatimonadaceae bacterium]|nr:asparagine synthase (glutamine-hydrolyzing) [Gemmatimonadaceae bacterium]
MCGIAGFLGTPASGTPDVALKAMTDVIEHRGPDADGAWCDSDARIALGHRRLSIIDLSPLGAQPMHAGSGRYVIAFNGEAYNYAPIRAELGLSGYPFKGHSDTEVLLAAFDTWGVEASVPKFAGMFAIAVWDRQERSLWLVRDRLGEKPLFYGKVGESWLFGSELKALRAFPGWRAAIDVTSVAQFLRHGYIQAPASIYEGISKVRPGTMVELRTGQVPREIVYWSAETAARAGLANPISGSADEIATALDAVLRPVVRDEMVADVPLGAFLSGGIDSSLIVALMQAQSTRSVRTFTIGFNDPRFNEAGFAREVATHLGTEHTELMVSGEDALRFVERLPAIYDEPMADSSQLPTLLISQMTRQHVTVALSGDGGDELFGGYSWYAGASGTADRLSHTAPALMRKMVGSVLRSIPDPPPDLIARLITDGDRAIGDRPANALTRLGARLVAPGHEASYQSVLAQSVTPADLMRPELRPRAGFGTLHGPWLDDTRTSESRMLFDAISYMPDDILVKVDRAAMAFSLETRAPLLDHRVFEFAWRIPYSDKVSEGVGKQPLRRLLFRYVPRELVERPKRGFAVPLAAWLRGPLRPWAEELLSAQSITAGGVLDVSRVRRLWSQHLGGLANHGDRLWAVLSLQAFLRNESRQHDLSRSA